jgi:hypothetical protein
MGVYPWVQALGGIRIGFTKKQGVRKCNFNSSDPTLFKGSVGAVKVALPEDPDALLVRARHVNPILQSPGTLFPYTCTQSKMLS